MPDAALRTDSPPARRHSFGGVVPPMPVVIRDVLRCIDSPVDNRGAHPDPFRAPDHRLVSTPPLVLLVEDFADTRELYVYYLSTHGFRVEEAATGHEGQHKALHLMPDVILMDLSLPGIDGWTLTRLLKSDSRTRHVPVIAVTAHARTSDREQAMAAGCSSFLVKPCPPRILVAEIARVLNDRPV